MRVGLDLQVLRFERTGMAAQAWWLARHMPAMAPNLTFVLFLPRGVEPPLEAPNVRLIRMPNSRFPGGAFIDEQWHLARAAGRESLDLLHTIAYGPPAAYRGLKILTMHDLGFKALPDTAPWRYRLYWNWAYGQAARGCRHLIAVSEHTRLEIVRHLGRRPEEITVIRCGVDPIYQPPAGGFDPAAAADRLGLPPHYILNVGTLQPRKDLMTLLNTFARLAAEDADLHLVVSGGRGWGYEPPAVLLRRTGLEGRVTFLGFAPRDRMPDLYRAARLMLFTSRYEGFGLPLLEAMACGTPVVTTGGTAIPEVVGDAALTAPVGDDAALAEAARRILTDADLHREMRSRGLERARLFSWEKAARETLAVYGAVLARSG